MKLLAYRDTAVTQIDSHKTLITPKAEESKEKGQESLSRDDSPQRHKAFKDFQVLEELEHTPFHQIRLWTQDITFRLWVTL